MKCSCPKCRAEIDLAVAEVTETGTPAACPLCSARLVVHRESFGARVYRKSGEISCATCGAILGPETLCLSCGTKFPDFLVVTQGRKPARKVQGVNLKGTHISAPKLTRRKLPLEPTASRDAKPVHQVPDSFGAVLLSKKMYLVIPLVLLVLILGGFLGYLHHKTAENYIDNFVKATYCMQSGAERSLKSCTKVAAEWKTRIDAGQNVAPRPAPEDERDLRIIRNQIDVLLQKMKDPPAKYREATDKLSRLNASFLKVSALALDPPSSLALLSDAAAKAEIDYRSAGKEFKSGLPDPLMANLRESAKRHQSLKPLVD